MVMTAGAAVLLPALFAARMGVAWGLTPWEGVLAIQVPAGLAWVLFGPLAMGVLRRPARQVAALCLPVMAAGAGVLGVAAWWPADLVTTAGGIFAAHAVMMVLFVRLGRRLGLSALRLFLLWMPGLDGLCLLVVGGVLWG